ncbi:hypothetical protein DPMN_177723 [Dreissena polymorpha]|uniref:Uncharacterized protein n=1 Tax=Dreissena polymorpha TaxID=45954 RepID=A0A9D4II22_DREPO|nr:hypothetical protein DPMN_177723 [Dreissena polymorpha]
MSRNDDMFPYSKGPLSMCTTFIERKEPAFVKIANKMNILRDMMPCYYIHDVEDLQMDYVRGFPCEVKDQLFEWHQRKRKNDWPPRSLVDAVASMNAVVVPTGQEGSHMSALQWRLCFPAGE